MTINQYQKEAMRTASGMNYENHGMLMNAALGICGEGGEVADLVKKATFQGHALDKEHIAKELGDVAWYIAVGAQAIGSIIVELPCRVGDDLYWISDENEVECQRNAIVGIVVEDGCFEALDIDGNIDKIGTRYAYFSREEAEKALKESDQK